MNIVQQNKQSCQVGVKLLLQGRKPFLAHSRGLDNAINKCSLVVSGVGRLEGQASERSNWLRVNKNSPCPICGKPDWCLVSQGGSAVICARVQSDREVGRAGWLHKLTESQEPIGLPKPRKHAQEAVKASPDILDKVYRSLLAELDLSKPHHDNLIARGMSEASIIAGGYKSLPRSGRPTLVNKLTQAVSRGELPILAGVPGFYMVTGELRYATLAGSVGMLIPVKDTVGRIGGLQVRCDSAGSSGGKYRWVSSPGEFGGCSSGSPIHVAGASYVSEYAVVTEGALKADIAASRLGCPVLGVAGVANYTGIIQTLKGLGVKEVVLAYDMDKVSNPMVKHHAGALAKALLSAGLKVYESSWPVEYKGIDDFLVSLPLRQSEFLENKPSNKEATSDTLPGSLSLKESESAVGNSDSNNGAVSSFHGLHYNSKNSERQAVEFSIQHEFYVQHIAKLTILASTLAKVGLKLKALGGTKTTGRLSSKQKVYQQHYDMLNGKGWLAWREYLESRGQTWSLDCLQYGHSWSCEAGEHIFEPSLCGDWHYCVVCGFRYEQIQAEAAMDKFMAIAKALPGIELLRLVFTLPQELWSKIGWSKFGILTKLAGESLALYYGGQPGGEFNCQYWHTSKPLPAEHGFYPHLHGAVLNIIRTTEGFKVVPAYIDELRLKTIWARLLGKQFKLEYRLHGATGKPQLKLKRGWSNINLRLAGYVPLNSELYVYSRGKCKGQKAAFTNCQYLKARLRYDFRMPQSDIAEFAQESGLERFSDSQKLAIDTLIGLDKGGERIGLPKNFRRERWFGWLGEGVVKKRLAELNITIPSAQERKAKAKVEAQKPMVCPEHDTLCSITRGSFGQFLKVSRWDLVPGDILLSANYRQDRRWWRITQEVYERWHVPKPFVAPDILF